MIHYLSQLQQTILRCWDMPAVCNWRGEQFTFAQLAEQIARFGVFFNKIGLKKGDKVALCATNSARWAVSFLSINCNGTVVVPLLAEFTPDSVASLVNHSESKLLFVNKETWAKMDKSVMKGLRAAISNSDYSLLWSQDDEIAAAYASLDEDFRAAYPNGFSKSDVNYPCDNWKDLAVINYTSGTTSAPKGVMLTYEAFCTSVDFAIRNIPASEKNNIVSMLPMGHIYGLVFEFLYPISCGVTVYYLGKAPSASTLLKAVADVKPYLVITVPLVMEKVYKSSIKPVLSKWYMKLLTSIPGVNKIIYKVIVNKLLAAFGGNVQEFIMGGAALNPDVEAVFRRIGLPYTVGYGMTEAAPLLAYSHWKDYVPGSCGKKVDSADVRINSSDPEHVPGEIQAKGTNITIGYFNNPEASAHAFTEDGYLCTGDLGTMDKNGVIVIRGRSKNMILSANGQNIYPEEVEAVVNAQDYVTESVVVSRNSKLVALVYLDAEAIAKSGLDSDAVSHIPDAILAKANHLLPSYSRLASIATVKEPFVKTPKMSIKRFMYK